MRSRVTALLSAGALLLGLVAVTSTAVVAPAAADPVSLSLDFFSGVNDGTLTKGDPLTDVTKYDFLIQRETTGNPDDTTYHCLPPKALPGPHDPAYPNNCQWPGTRTSNTGDPIVASGNETTIANGDVLLAKLAATCPAGQPCRFLISIKADGYEIGGAHFTLPLSGPLAVSLLKYPLPLATVRVRIFQDTVPADGVYEIDAETGIAGFRAYLNDMLGDVSTDYYGNPICTQYLHVPAASAVDAGKIRVGSDGAPLIDPTSTGQCVSDGQGDIVIPNMAPGRYGIVIRQPADKRNWLQTTTLEGAQDHDWWVMAGDTGYGTETTAGGELVPEVQFGFVPPEPDVAQPWTGFDFTPTVLADTFADAPDPSADSAVGTTGGITGSVHEGCTYIASVGGGYVPNSVPGANGTQDCGPISKPLIAVSGLDVGDQVVWAGTGNADGTYTVPHLADGSYMVTVWDSPINHILETFNVTVTNDEVINAGVTYLGGWFTHITGSVFVDTNGNGRRDAGEQGVVRTNVTFRERDNTPFDQFTNSINTDANGNYDIKQSYPLSRFTILEHSDLRYKATGMTIQACNEKKATTYLGGAVDVSVLPVIGLCGKVDWAVQPYATGETGGIVGTVTYGTTRNETDPADAATESWQPGIQGIPVHLFAAKRDSVTGELVRDTTTKALVHGPELADTYTSESYKRPQACVARDRTGAILTGEQVLADPSATVPGSNPVVHTDCVEAPLAGFMAKPSDPTPGASSQDVNGNYGFGTSRLNLYDPTTTSPCSPEQMATITSSGEYPLTHCVPVFNGAPLALYAPLDGSRIQELGATGEGADLSAVNLPYIFPDEILTADDYIVSVDIPQDALGNPMYKVTKEEDVNIFGGDDMTPQEGIATPTGVVPGAGADCAPDSTKPLCNGTKVGLGVLATCAGPNHLVTVTNPDLIAGGGSPYDGTERPLCADKLVNVVDATQQATNFELFTDVPLAAHFWGLILNDLGVSSDPTKIQYGEVEGLQKAPTGIYDWAGNLVDTAIADPNGFYEALEPSTTRINNPSPTGVSPGMYRFVGNDPGTAGHLNPTYDSRYRTIATNFQAWPGLWTVTDTAPTLTAAQTYNGQMTAVKCLVPTGEPQLFAVNDPVTKTGAVTSVTITGRDFGAAQGSHGAVLLGAPHDPAADPTKATPLTVTDWDPKGDSITVSVPAAGPGFAPGPRELLVRADGGKVSTSGITLHVIGGSYRPTVITVGPSSPTRTYDVTTTDPAFWDANPVAPAYIGHPLQAAIDRAAALETSSPTHTADVLVVAYPQAPTDNPILPNPNGAYYENLVVHSGVRVQGVGPGGFKSDGSYVLGSVIDGSNFQEGQVSGTHWLGVVSTLAYSNSDIPLPDSAAVTVVSAAYAGDRNGDYKKSGTSPALDGFTITGGIQSTTPTNINILTGGAQTPYGGTGAVVTQGGGVYVHGGTDGLVVSNNKIDGNSGSYAGGIRVGTPYANGNIGISASGTALTDADPTTASTGYRLVNNKLVVAHNSVTNNGGANLGGGVGLFSGTVGYRVAYNDVCGNFSAEYGGGISHYGFSRLSRIDHNRVWFNESYDEGGGILVAGEVPPTPDKLSGGAGDVTVDSNRIDQNLSNDDGGGIRLLNAGVRAITIENNEIVNNVSAHEGGGIALNEATSVTIDNNTVAGNVTTATAVTSDGSPAAAGLATSGLSQQLGAFLVALGRPNPISTDPVAFNNVFWDNRAGTFDGQTIVGIGNTDANVIDIGSTDTTAPVALRNSVITDSATTAIVPGGGNTSGNPNFVTPFTVSVHADARRSFTAFRQTVITDMTQSPWNAAVSSYALGDATSAAVDLGTAVGAPALDLTGFARSVSAGGPTPDAGALEFFASPFPSPSAPTAVTVTPDNHSLTVGWTAPAVVSPAVTGYTVQLWSAADATGTYQGGCVVPSGTTSCTLGGLTNGTTYFADVIASNAVGSSSASSPRTAGTPHPIAPTNVVATASNHGLNISWSAPASVSPVLSYTASVWSSSTGGTSPVVLCTKARVGANAPATACTATSVVGLENGVTYYVDVTADFGGGLTATSSPRATGIPNPAMPEPPTISRVAGLTTSATSLNVTWAPGLTGGVPVNYVVRAYTGATGSPSLGSTCTTQVQPCRITGLVRGSQYYIGVTATNTAGSTESVRVLGIPAAAPSVPSAVTLKLGGAAGALDASWGVPASNGGAPIATYTATLYYAGTNSAAATCTTPAATMSCSFTGLPRLTGGGSPQGYTVRVSATNVSFLTGPPSGRSAPVQPTLRRGLLTVVYTPGPKGTMTVAWTPPRALIARSTSYTVRIYPSRTSNRVLTTCKATAAIGACTVRGLVSGRTYYVSAVPTGATWPVIKVAVRLRGHAR